MLPIGVVIPTKNSMPYLPGHLENLATWIDLAEQVVVVDSSSSDGTVDYIAKNLRHPQIRFVQHPPGLYASWNCGIGEITSEFCYISTVGDSITRAGIEHLAGAAALLKCDVLVSRPDFVNEAGQTCAGPEWPMDGVIKYLALQGPVRLSSAVIIATSLANTGGAITGSCASDLFRARILQKNPFPLDFGVSGDAAWSLQNAGRIQWATTPSRMTTFRRHPTVASAQEVKEGQTSNQFALLATNMVAEWLESYADDVSIGDREDIKRLLPLCIAYDQSRRQYNSQRIGAWPWILNPSAWMNRSKRNQLKSQVDCLARQIYDNMPI